MSLIQLIIVISALVLFILYTIYFRSVVRDRLFVLILVITALMATIFPNRTTDVARFLGVGRGTDLIFYLFIISSVFVAMLFYNKVAKLEKIQTELIRALALKQAETPDQAKN